MAVISIEKDAVWGPIPIEILARVSARMEEPDRAMAALEKLLPIPYDGIAEATRLLGRVQGWTAQQRPP